MTPVLWLYIQQVTVRTIYKPYVTAYTFKQSVLTKHKTGMYYVHCNYTNHKAWFLHDNTLYLTTWSSSGFLGGCIEFAH